MFVLAARVLVSTVSVWTLAFALIKSIKPELLTSTTATDSGPLPTVNVVDVMAKPPLPLFVYIVSVSVPSFAPDQINLAISIDVHRRDRPWLAANAVGAGEREAAAAVVGVDRQRVEQFCIRANQIHLAVAVDIRCDDRPGVCAHGIGRRASMKPPLPLFVNTESVPPPPKFALINSTLPSPLTSAAMTE